MGRLAIQVHVTLVLAKLSSNLLFEKGNKNKTWFTKLPILKTKSTSLNFLRGQWSKFCAYRQLWKNKRKNLNTTRMLIQLGSET